MNDVEKILISQDEIVARCKELGKQISEDYKDTVPVLIGLLKGSVPFMAELMKYIDIDCKIEFMDVTSYSGTESTGDVKIVKDLDCSIKDLDVLIIEDIVDTGKTLEKVKELLYSK
ncbi:MAG: hypoxanthine phosphoribosyltransferase, partial [Erysipelotrichaceae bacterium]|nr:hypoxanthine phosphoribosyltransferase [Erysipelotrichaceae bacterium]